MGHEFLSLHLLELFLESGWFLRAYVGYRRRFRLPLGWIDRQVSGFWLNFRHYWLDWSLCYLRFVLELQSVFASRVFLYLDSTNHAANDYCLLISIDFERLQLLLQQDNCLPAQRRQQPGHPRLIQLVNTQQADSHRLSVTTGSYYFKNWAVAAAVSDEAIKAISFTFFCP